jgi:murein DD-endopeptidase MepM/ murein hydrolase activator NlpD
MTGAAGACGALLLCAAGFGDWSWSAPAPSKAAAKPPPARERAVALRSSGSLRAALMAVHAPAEEVDAALLVLSERVDPDAVRPAGRYEALMSPGGAQGAHLMGVVVHGEGEVIEARRRADGGYYFENGPNPVAAVRAASQAASVRPVVVRGPVERVLSGFGARRKAGLAPAKVLALFGHRLDLTTDIGLGDEVTLVIDPSAPGPWGGVLFAQIVHDGRTTQAYDCVAPAADPIDGDGRPLTSGFLRTPLTITVVTSAFGPRKHPILGAWRLHKGTDFRAATGTPVLAAADGRIVSRGVDGGYGRQVVLDHAGGWRTRYAHLSRWAIGLAPGDLVHQGQVIGYVGATGLATAPHLHYEIDRDGAAVDPEQVGPDPGEAPQPGRLRDEQRCVDAVLAENAAAPRPSGDPIRLR